MQTIRQNQFGGMNMIYSRASLRDFLDSMCRIGIENVELWTQLQFFCEYYKSTSDVNQLKKELDTRNLKLICFIPEQCIWPYNIASSNREIRRESCEYYLRHLDIARKLGCGKVLLTPGWYEWDKKREDGFKYSEESLRKILPFFRGAQITPVLEILQPAESNLMYDLKTVWQYAAHFTEEELNFCIDTVPVALAGEKLESYFQKLGSRIRHLHLIDGTPAGHLVLGDGNHNIREQIRTMGKYHYNGYVTLEFGASVYYKSPEFHMKRGWDYLKKILSEDAYEQET